MFNKWKDCSIKPLPVLEEMTLESISYVPSRAEMAMRFQERLIVSAPHLRDGPQRSAKLAIEHADALLKAMESPLKSPPKRR